MAAPAENTGHELDLSLLEPFLRELVDLVGVVPTMAIVQAYGGTSLFISREPGEDSLLARVVGMQDAAVIGRALGTDRRFVPKASAALRDLRDRQIRHDLMTMSVRQVARKYRLGERWVWVIQAQGERVPDPQSPGLFD